MNTEISETIRGTILGIGMQVPSFLRSASLFQQRTTPTLTPTKAGCLLGQRKFDSANKAQSCGSYSFDARRQISKLWLLQF